MWYLHKLIDGDLTNYIIVTRYDIDYNCEHVCLGRSENKGVLQMDLRRLQGLRLSKIITPEGSFNTAGKVANAVGLSLTRVRKLLRACRNWSRQWPPGWSEAGVRGPRIRRGRILHVGDKHYWEFFCFEGVVTKDTKKALNWVKNTNWKRGSVYVPYDYKAYKAALKSGSGFPEATGAVSNCVYYGDEFVYDEIEKLEPELFRSIVC